MIDISISAGSVSGRALSALMDQVHDWWFDLDSVEYSADSRSITICLGPSKNALRNREVTVKGVASLDVEDGAQIGIYDLEAITFDAAKNRIVLKSTMPLRLVLHLLDGWELTCRDRR